MSNPPKIPAALLVIFNQFLKLGKYNIEYFGSIRYPLICVGESTSCPAYATNWLADNAKRDTFWHSHPSTLKRSKTYRAEIEYLSPADILFFLSYRHTKTYLFTLKCIYKFNFPKGLKYSKVRSVVDDILFTEQLKKKNKNKKSIMFPLSNQDFCRKLGIKRSVLITKAQTKKLCGKRKKCRYCDEEED